MLGWTAALTLVGAAALHPSMTHTAGQVPAKPAAVSPLRLTLYVLLIVTSGVLAAYTLTRVPRHQGAVSVLHVVIPVILLCGIATVATLHTVLDDPGRGSGGVVGSAEASPAPAGL
ncbi:hypothetical protein [Couchioplanes caeruleus]|uniref:Uncharacterized protein n=2 Tax=Couchioplanes caeruleus TaxID=56438 RepID=A0A1K0GWY2_9ACTN|nr:hypothetical protein [Couchioplanes caeruleus]OJF15908.1 hypothetical protein BG844_01330 [Couchioplanes caeruleus subsp. caeruleus]ROP28490.1 hypothetical protein EDD30_1254 [Couchioplanes caeruleus]